MLNYIAMSTIPIMIFVILLIGIKEKKDVFKLFIEGALDGLKIVYTIFPYILAITVAIGIFKSTGAIDIVFKPISPILEALGIPRDIVPLAVLRPLSGGASMSLVMEIFKENGPDSVSGKIASIIMGGTETTLYTVTILFGAAKVKKLRGTLVAGLIADAVAIIAAITIVRMGII